MERFKLWLGHFKFSILNKKTSNLLKIFKQKFKSNICEQLNFL